MRRANGAVRVNGGSDSRTGGKKTLVGVRWGVKTLTEGEWLSIDRRHGTSNHSRPAGVLVPP